MFGINSSAKDKNQKPADEVVHDIGVIPDIFYGGNDPDIYAEKEVKKETAAVVKPAEMAAHPVEKREPFVPRTAPPRRMPPPPLPAAPAVAAPVPDTSVQMQKPVQVQSSHSGLIFGLIFFLLVAGAGAAWYFFFREKPLPPTSVVKQETPPAPVTIPAAPIQPPVVTTTLPGVPEIPPTPTSSLVRERSLPFLSLSVAVDPDSDKLSSDEEELFQVDPEVWDTDKDGYYDGQEVYNLYNPKGLAPMRIIDSGLVREYVNPQWQYRVYYPVVWEATPLDLRNGNEVLFNAAQGDYIQIKAYTKLTGESFPGWFGRVVNDQIYTDLTEQSNRFQIPYYRRKDGLVNYIDTPNSVYILILYSRTDGSNDFVHVNDMMVQSFRPGKVTAELPLQPILPVPGSVQTSTSISSSTTFLLNVLSTTTTNIVASSTVR